VQLRPEQLAAALEKRLERLYVVHGDEPLLSIEAADAIRAAARRQGYDEREVLVVTPSFRWEDLFMAAGNLSLFGGNKLVDLRIPSGKPGREGSEALQRYSAQLPDGVVTLVSLPEMDWTAKKAAWFAKLAEAGAAIECNGPPLAQLPGWIAQRLARQKQNAPRDALEFIAAHVEGNLLAAHQEIQKLGLLYPEGELSLADVEGAVLNVARYDVRRLRQAIAANDTVRCARTIDGLKAEGAAPPLVLWALATEARSRAARAALLHAARIDRMIKGLAMAASIRARRDELLAANAADLDEARANGLEPAMIDRLTLTAKGVESMAQGLEQVAALADPVGEITDLKRRPTGIQVGKMRVPLGVVGIIYEARPNVTADAAALCLKSGNAAILRGGKEAIRSNQAIAACVRDGLKAAGLPETAVQVIETTDREAVGHLVAMPQYVDVIVPRGGKGLIERISKEARVPVIKHLDGNCHVYIDADADPEKALRIVENAKTQRLGTCNTAESLLVAREVSESMLPEIANLLQAKGVEIRGCPETLGLVSGAKAATEEDYYTEYLAAIISVKVVDGLDAAIAHINQYSSAHTEAIVTENYTAALRFLREVDSSSVMVNASTRFADGFEYGLGAEIGISTDKFHARGPVGLEGLTSQKWIVLGDGEVRG